MKTARQLLGEKQIHHLVTIPSGATVFQALQIFAEWNVGAALVMDEDKLIGIFSERDYARKVALQGRSTATTRVNEVMTSQVVCVRAETYASECLALITEKRIRHLPVKEEGKVIGVLSIGDLVRATIAEQRFTIEQLESYIYR
ncbi:MAG: histidine kinase [Proteobacteria bacterium]|nr:histidine kinase [Pseudomonadota bacterium]